MKTSISCSGLFFLALFSVSLNGLVELALWNWAIVALLGVPSIDFWQAVGLALVLGFVANWFRSRA